MAHNFLLFGLSGAIGWVFIYGPPSMQPREGSPASQIVAADPYAFPSVSAACRLALEIRRDPVPFVRSARPIPVAPVAPPSNESSVAAPEQQDQDDLEKKTAKMAVELDGYKRVSIIDKAPNGAWRAKGYRGTTEVLLTVDGTGRVSMD